MRRLGRRLPKRWEYPPSTCKWASSLCCQAGGAIGGQLLMPKHAYRICMLFFMCVLGKARIPPLTGQGKAAGDQGWPRATPAAKHGVQLHLVGSETPTPSVTMSLWPLQGMETEEIGPGDSSFTSGPGLLQHLGMLWLCHPVDDHAKAAACTQINLLTHMHRDSLTAGAQPAMPLRPGRCVLRLPCACRRRLNEGSCLSARWEQS